LADLLTPSTDLHAIETHVIFVHGLKGDKEQTWRSPGKNGAFWPRWLESDLQGVAVLSVGYSSPATRWGGSAMHLPDAAENILARIDRRPRGSNAAISASAGEGSRCAIESACGCRGDQTARLVDAGAAIAWDRRPRRSPTSDCGVQRRQIRHGNTRCPSPISGVVRPPPHSCTDDRGSRGYPGQSRRRARSDRGAGRQGISSGSARRSCCRARGSCFGRPPHIVSSEAAEATKVRRLINILLRSDT
jgi:hypothetical protein